MFFRHVFKFLICAHTQGKDMELKEKKEKKSELVVSSAKMKAIDFERLNVSYHDSPCKQTLSLKDLIKQIIFNE